MASDETKGKGEESGKGKGEESGKGKGKGSGKGKGEEREPFREDEGTIRVHEAYQEHRLGGGEPATPEAYRQAVERFRKLPGAVRSTPPMPPPKTTDDQPETDGDDADKGGPK